jgi:hypothetical protein
MLAVAWPFGCPPRFTDTGGGQTRLAQGKGSVLTHSSRFRLQIVNVDDRNRDMCLVRSENSIDYCLWDWPRFCSSPRLGFDRGLIRGGNILGPLIFEDCFGTIRRIRIF